MQFVNYTMRKKTNIGLQFLASGLSKSGTFHEKHSAFHIKFCEQKQLN